jgi:hypothetical protein
MSIKPGDFVRYVLGSTLVAGEWQHELSDDLGTVISVNNGQVQVQWSGPRLEMHSLGELSVIED